MDITVMGDVNSSCFVKLMCWHIKISGGGPRGCHLFTFHGYFPDSDAVSLLKGSRSFSPAPWI